MNCAHKGFPDLLLGPPGAYWSWVTSRREAYQPQYIWDFLSIKDALYGTQQFHLEMQSVELMLPHRAKWKLWFETRDWDEFSFPQEILLWAAAILQQFFSVTSNCCPVLLTFSFYAMEEKLYQQWHMASQCTLEITFVALWNAEGHRSLVWDAHEEHLGLSCTDPSLTGNQYPNSWWR